MSTVMANNAVVANGEIDLSEQDLGVKQIRPDFRIVEAEFKLGKNKGHLILRQDGQNKEVCVNVEGQPDVTAESAFKGTWQDGEISVNFPQDATLAEIKINGSGFIKIDNSGKAQHRGVIFVRDTNHNKLIKDEDGL